MEEKTLFNIKEVCSLLGISRKTLQRLRDEKKINYFQIGRQIRFSKDQILEFLERNEKSNSV